MRMEKAIWKSKEGTPESTVCHHIEKPERFTPSPNPARRLTTRTVSSVKRTIEMADSM
jgi:hypothetical protein